MFSVELGNEYLVNETGTSEGTQIKYRKDQYWYKQDHNGQEGLSEYLVSRLLQYSDLDPAEYIVYEQGTINGKAGCRSKNFLEKGASLVTFYRLYYNEFGKNLSEEIAGMEKMEERIAYVVRFIRESCGLDVTDYLKKTLTLDMLVLNEDRHLNNLAVVWDGENFFPAPIFDNGVSLLTANRSVNWHFDVSENVKKISAKPFSGSHEAMVQYFGCGFLLDYSGIHAWLLNEPDSREKQVLEYQLGRYEKELKMKE